MTQSQTTPTPDLAARRPTARTVTGWTIALMVALRIAIGWHFAYEGVYKLKEDHWTATNYLVASAGPFRPLFVAMVNDPDSINDLTPAAVKQELTKRWNWLQDQYDLDSDQKSTGEALVKKQDDKIDAIFNDPGFQAQLDDYKKLLGEIQAIEQQDPRPEFKTERMVYMYGRKAQARDALLARVNQPIEAVIGATYFSLSSDQLKNGGKPWPKTSKTWWIDYLNMYGLTIFGVCLMLGLFTRLSALGAAALLVMYYLAIPPWPGLPENPMTEGHYLIVNKNLIEFIALLMIATSRVGRWAGLDAYIARIRQSVKCKTPQPAPQQSSQQPASDAPDATRPAQA